VSLANGSYRFSVTSDDGVRFYVDGALKLDKWFLQGATSYTVDLTLSAGNHTLTLEYYENTGGATARLSWATGQPKGVFTTRKYGDPRMVELMELDTANFGTGNFQNIDLFFPPNTSFGAVTNFQLMDTAALKYLESIQPVDAVALKRKMNWLGIGSTRGRPYMTKAAGIAWGTMVFGGQKVLVETDTTGKPVSYFFKAKYQGPATSQLIEFFKLIGMRRHEMGLFKHETHPWFIQKATEAYYPTNEYNEHVQGGTIYNPVWSPSGLIAPMTASRSPPGVRPKVRGVWRSSCACPTSRDLLSDRGAGLWIGLWGGLVSSAASARITSARSRRVKHCCSSR